jgi:hypothetical protein
VREDRGEPPLRLVYIASRPHSGSTLLDLLISRHSQGVSVGEVNHLPKLIDKKCSCGVSRISDCEFWRAVSDKLKEGYGRTLREIDINADDASRFAADNEALFRAVQAVSGKSLIVDSSKDLSRLKKLLACDGLLLTPIFLRRRSGGVVYSNVRKGRPWVRSALAGFAMTRDHLRFFRTIDNVLVRYEDLCTSPALELQRIMHAAGVTFEPSQLAWSEMVRHNIGGNRMRFSRDHTIRLDEQWRLALSGHQRLLLDLLDNDMLLRSVPLPRRKRVLKVFSRYNKSSRASKR